MDVLNSTPKRNINLQSVPPRVQKTGLFLLPSFVRFQTRSLILPNRSISLRETDDILLPIGNSSVLRNDALTSTSETRRNIFVCKASNDLFANGLPKLSKKPKWWWRIVAGIPYLHPLHNVWLYADRTFYLHHILEKYEFLTYRFLDAIALLPSWLVSGICLGMYYLVVRRKEWPHFVRFHVAMAILFDTCLQVTGKVCNLLPKTVFTGNFMVCFWVTLAFLQGYTVLECIKCALAGKYADVPFMSDNALTHCDLNLLK